MPLYDARWSEIIGGIWFQRNDELKFEHGSLFLPRKQRPRGKPRDIQDRSTIANAASGGESNPKRLKFPGLLDRQVRGLGALQVGLDVNGQALADLRAVGAIRHKATTRRMLGPLVNGVQPVLHGESLTTRINWRRSITESPRPRAAAAPAGW